MMFNKTTYVLQWYDRDDKEWVDHDESDEPYTSDCVGRLAIARGVRARHIERNTRTLEQTLFMEDRT